MEKRQLAGGLAVLLVLLWAWAAAAGGPEEEATTGTAREGTGEEPTDTSEDTSWPDYRGSEEAAMPFYRQAETAYDERRYEDAARFLRQAYEAHEHPLVVYNIAVCERMAGNHEAAITAYRQYVQLCPRQHLITEVYIQMGECLLNLDRRQEANEAFQHYLNLERDGASAPVARRAIETGEAPSDQERRDPAAVRQAQELCDRAEALSNEGQFEQAALLYIQGYERMPDMHELLFDAGLCYLDAEMLADGTRTLSRYVQTPGADPLALYFLGEAYADQFDFSSAVDTFELYLERAPDGEWRDEAREFINETMPYPSETGVRRETGATPGEFERAQVHYNAGIEHFEAGRYREAIEAFERGYEIVPSRVLVYNIGLCLARLGQWQEALTRFEQFLERDDEGMSAIVHLEAAECLIELHQPQDAIRHLDQFAARARESDLDNEETHTARAQQLRERAQGGGGTGGTTTGGGGTGDGETSD